MLVYGTAANAGLGNLEAQPQLRQQYQSGCGLADERAAQAVTVRNSWRADIDGVRCSQARY